MLICVLGRVFGVVPCLIFLLVKVKGQRVLCRFYGGVDGDCHLFWKLYFSSSG